MVARLPWSRERRGGWIERGDCLTKPWDYYTADKCYVLVLPPAGVDTKASEGKY